MLLSSPNLLGGENRPRHMKAQTDQLRSRLTRGPICIPLTTQRALGHTANMNDEQNRRMPAATTVFDREDSEELHIPTTLMHQLQLSNSDDETCESSPGKRVRLQDTSTTGRSESPAYAEELHPFPSPPFLAQEKPAEIGALRDPGRDPGRAPPRKLTAYSNLALPPSASSTLYSSLVTPAQTQRTATSPTRRASFSPRSKRRLDEGSPRRRKGKLKANANNGETKLDRDRDQRRTTATKIFKRFGIGVGATFSSQLASITRELVSVRTSPTISPTLAYDSRAFGWPSEPLELPGSRPANPVAGILHTTFRKK